jgi:hypothetical protein
MSHGYMCYSPGCPLAMVFKILPLGYWGYSPGSHPGYGFYIYHLVIGAIARVVPWLWLKKKTIWLSVLTPLAMII